MELFDADKKKSGNAKKKKFSPFTLILAIISSLILVKGATMLYRSIQPATVPPALSSISGKNLEKGEYYYGNIQVLRELSYSTSKINGVPFVSQKFLAAFEDADSVWNYVIFEPKDSALSYGIFEPGATRPVEGESFRCYFKVVKTNESIVWKKDRTIDQYDSEFFDAAVERYDTAATLKESSSTIGEYIEDHNRYKRPGNVLGAVAVLAIGLIGLFLARKQWLASQKAAQKKADAKKTATAYTPRVNTTNSSYRQEQPRKDTPERNKPLGNNPSDHMLNPDKKTSIEKIKTTRCVISDGKIGTSYTVKYVDGLGNQGDIYATKHKTSNSTTYILYSCESDEDVWLFEQKALALLRNDFQARISTWYDSEYILADPPWMAEHSFCLEGCSFTLKIDYVVNYISLENDSDSTGGIFPDQLAAYMSNVLGVTADETFRNPPVEKKSASPEETPKAERQAVNDATPSLQIFKEANEKCLQGEEYRNEWIHVSSIGNSWSNITVYINPTKETAKICSRECTYWGYHDESEWDDHEEIVSIEQALAQVYPDEKAISVILSNTKKDYSDTLKKLAERNTKPIPPAKTPKAKWQAVYDAAASLHIFKEANEKYLQGDGYQKLIELLSEKYHNLDKMNYTNPQWEESFRELSITGAFEHWVGHDDTLYESIKMTFKRLQPEAMDNPSEWSAESEWPCEGEFQYINESKDEGDNWNYSRMSHKAWMLKAPFGLPGVWSFEYTSKDSRS